MTWDELRHRQHRIVGVFLLAMTLSNLANVRRLTPLLRQGYQDFTIFYGAGKMVRDGQARRLYDLNLQYEIQQSFAPDVANRRAALPYNHPPFEALLFVPLAHLRYFPAYLVWTCLNLIMLAVSIGIARRVFSEGVRLNWLFVFVAASAFPPILIALVQGQDSVLLLMLAVLSAALLATERDAMAGAILALGLFKFQIALPLAVVLAARRPRLLLGFAPGALVLGCVSAAMVGWSGLAGYAAYVLRLEKSGGGGSIPSVGMPNLHGLVASIAGAEAGSGWALWLTIAASVALLVAAAWFVAKHRPAPGLTFATAIVAALMVSYHGLIHDMTLLLPAMLFLFFAREDGARREMRMDAVSLMLPYVIFWLFPEFPWLSPLWFVPMAVWILRRFRKYSPVREFDPVG